MSTWTKFATGFYQQQKKKNPHYKFSQALKDAAKMYKKRGGDVKVGGGKNPMTDDLLQENENVKNAAQVESVVAAAPAADLTVAAPAEIESTDSKPAADSTVEPVEPVGEVVRQNAASELDTSDGGKKAKKSAKKGKKSVKKGGKKGKKSAKKSRR